MAKRYFGHLVRNTENPPLSVTTAMQGTREKYWKNVIKTETKSGVFYSKKHQNCKRKMEIIKECGVCGKAFVASKMSFKYCCRGCERVAFRRREAEKKKREKENAESLLNAERNNSLRDKAFLSPEDVSVLFDVSLPTVYRYFQTGLIKAVKIRNKTFVRYSDI